MKDPGHHFITKAINRLRIRLTKKKRLMAQAQDLQRQLAEAWREKDHLEAELADNRNGWAVCAEGYRQLEAENETLRGRIIHAETFDSELPNSAYSVIEFDSGVTRTWDSLTDLQKKYWIGLASLREKQ